MKMRFLVLAFAALVLSNCSTEDSAPDVIQMTLNDSHVPAGSIITVWVNYRVAATDHSSDPFFSVIALPVGADFVAGTSLITYGSFRAPDEIGSCPNGTTYLAYAFKQGDFTDPFYSDKFVGVLQFNVKVRIEANAAKIIAGVSAAPISDPCGPISGDSLELGVEAGGTPQTPTPVNTPA